MAHKCHWPGCEVEVPPAMWGCKPHWFSLPKRLRDLIWANYRRGQEVTKTPSAGYIDAAKQVQDWIQSRIASQRGYDARVSRKKLGDCDVDPEMHL